VRLGVVSGDERRLADVHAIVVAALQSGLVEVERLEFVDDRQAVIDPAAVTVARQAR